MHNDISFITQKEAEELSYHLCYLHQGASCSVSIPTPIYCEQICVWQLRKCANQDFSPSQMLMWVFSLVARILLTNTDENRKSVIWPGNITLTHLSTMEIATSHLVEMSHSMRKHGRGGWNSPKIHRCIGSETWLVCTSWFLYFLVLTMYNIWRLSSKYYDFRSSLVNKNSIVNQLGGLLRPGLHHTLKRHCMPLRAITQS